MVKLQLGSCQSFKEGWINTDGFPENIRDVHVKQNTSKLDVTKPFPFSDESVDFMLAEHLIEHITYKEAEFMLNESTRVLKSGGVLRLSTPDISFIMNLRSPLTINSQYIDFISSKFLPSGESSAIHVINNAFRNWGHQFLYDEGTLISLAERCHFNVTRVPYGVSDYPELNNIEQHGINIGNIPLTIAECMVFELKKE